ncbi:helix-turn-helix domain-containing protein [Acidaminobacter sp. JC074]|uniref:helix-turn-helix domain-containing protein n=1 Tax=Acidaminobacter sp. JC074 TaxID=2530199 RepID=UPI001F107945|nr:helix-turn-helix domain-containing protein [Acidaminobacter sp. JC074]
MRDFYTPKEVAKILSVHEKTVRRYLRDGVLRGQKLGGSWKVSKEVLMSYMGQRPEEFEDPFDMESKSTIRMSLNIEIDVKNAKEGHKLAQKLMDIINKNDYPSCDFKYKCSKKLAKYDLSGSYDFLKTALDILSAYES